MKLGASAAATDKNTQVSATAVLTVNPCVLRGGEEDLALLRTSSRNLFIGFQFTRWHLTISRIETAHSNGNDET